MNKRTRLASMLALVIVLPTTAALTLNSGCANLTKQDPQTGEVTDSDTGRQIVDAGEQVKAIGEIVAPATGGLSVVIGNALFSLLMTGLAINRHIVAQNRRKAIAEIDASESSPRAVDQVASVKSRRTVEDSL